LAGRSARGTVNKVAKLPGVSERSWAEAIAGIYARPPGSRPPLRAEQCRVGNAPAAGKSPAGRARSLCYTAAACLAAVNVFAMARAGCLQLHVPIKHQNKSKVWTIHPLNDQGSASRVQDQDSHGSSVHENRSGSDLSRRAQSVSPLAQCARRGFTLRATADQEREGQGSMTAAYELHELALKHIREEDSIQQARFRLGRMGRLRGATRSEIDKAWREALEEMRPHVGR
jgi:hypothetical protein